MINVGLNDVSIFEFASCRKCGLDGIAQIDANYVARTPRGSELSVPAFAATTFQHQFGFKEVGRDRRQPTEKLIRVKLVALDKVLPLPAEILSCRGFVRRHRRKRGKPRYPSHNRKPARTRIAGQLTGNDFVVLSTV